MWKRPECTWRETISSFLREQNIPADTIGELEDKLVDHLISMAFNEVYSEEFFAKEREDIGLKTQDFDNLLHALCSIIFALLDGEEPQYTMLRPILCDELRIFGERKSAIIKELEAHHIDDCRPIHRPELLFGLRRRDQYLSVPYDANISFIVYRKDIMDVFAKLLMQPGIRKKYTEEIRKLVHKQETLFNERIFPSKKSPDLVVNSLIDSFLDSKKMTTWEEVIAFLSLLPLQGKQLRGCLHFLIETQTMDTILCTVLEFLWSTGATLTIRPDYSIKDKESTKKELLRVFLLLSILFQKKIIPLNSTVIADAFNVKKTSGDSREQDWVFARHWYSTFIEILTDKKVDGGKHEFLWNAKDIDLDIMPIPVSFSNYMNADSKPKHISCWGDWHLCVINGSENTQLGIDLINNIMSSERICERAAANVALPTAQVFYDLYGDRKCFNIPERPDIKISNVTYSDLRSDFFENARSRSQIFDYHHCMREFHSLIEYVRLGNEFYHKNGFPSPSYILELERRIDQIFTTIEGFVEKPFLMA